MSAHMWLQIRLSLAYSPVWHNKSLGLFARWIGVQNGREGFSDSARLDVSEGIVYISSAHGCNVCPRVF